MMRKTFVLVSLFSVGVLLGAGACSSSESENPSGSAPFAPTRLGVQQMGAGIHLTWKDNAADEDEFEIERKEEGGAFAKIAAVTFDVVQYHDTAVSAGRTYVYRVRATHASAPSPYSNEASMQAPASATGGDAGGGSNDGGSVIGWDGGSVSFTQHIVPLLQKSCGAASVACHARDGYGANKDMACRGWVTFENAPLGAQFYGGTNAGKPTGCPDRSLYDRLTQLDAWQEPNKQLRRYVKPNDPANSYLFNKISGGPYGEDRPGVLSEPMPMNASLSAQDIAMVKKWIESGAPSN